MVSFNILKRLDDYHRIKYIIETRESRKVTGKESKSKLVKADPEMSGLEI